jgi:hypothetical protein
MQSIAFCLLVARLALGRIVYYVFESNLLRFLAPREKNRIRRYRSVVEATDVELSSFAVPQEPHRTARVVGAFDWTVTLDAELSDLAL